MAGLTIWCRRYALCINDTWSMCMWSKQHYLCKVMQPSFIFFFYWLPFLFFSNIHMHYYKEFTRLLRSFGVSTVSISVRTRFSAVFSVLSHVHKKTPPKKPTTTKQPDIADVQYSILQFNMASHKMCWPFFKRFLNYLLFITYFKIVFSPFR